MAFPRIPVSENPVYQDLASSPMLNGIIADTLKIRPHSWVLGIGTLICFAEVVHGPTGSDPGPWVTAVLGILLLRRAIIATPQPTVVVLSGCFLTLLVVAANHGLLNINKPLWIGFMLAGFAGFGFWERIEKLWK
jgi:hypothetical protein